MMRTGSITLGLCWLLVACGTDGPVDTETPLVIAVAEDETIAPPLAQDLAPPPAFAPLAAPTADDLAATPLTLWSTNYYTPVYATSEAGLPLLNSDNEPISGGLSREEWCNVALQGSASLIAADGTVTAFVYADQEGPEQTNCDDRLGTLSAGIKRATRRIRFSAVAHPYGCGVRDWPLIPYRTIAVDPDTLPYRTTVYIPELDGEVFELEGESFTHDGFVFAADKGGAIKGNHIDFFSGHSQRVPFLNVVTSNEDKTIEAFLVSADRPQARALNALHAPSCSG